MEVSNRWRSRVITGEGARGVLPNVEGSDFRRRGAVPGEGEQRRWSGSSLKRRGAISAVWQTSSRLSLAAGDQHSERIAAAAAGLGVGSWPRRRVPRRLCKDLILDTQTTPGATFLDTQTTPWRNSILDAQTTPGAGCGCVFWAGRRARAGCWERPAPNSAR